MIAALVPEMAVSSLQPLRRRFSGGAVARAQQEEKDAFLEGARASMHILLMVREFCAAHAGKPDEVVKLRASVLAIGELVAILRGAGEAFARTAKGPGADEAAATLEDVLRPTRLLEQTLLARLTELAGGFPDISALPADEGGYIDFDEARAQVLSGEKP